MRPDACALCSLPQKFSCADRAFFGPVTNGVYLMSCRQDSSTAFSAEQCKQGAGGGILLERLMPEIAYKLGRAHKYGA